MGNNGVIINYKIYLEAEDVTQSRIKSTKNFVSGLFLNCSNTYFKQAEITDESDMDDFSLRLYVDFEKQEEICQSPEDAELFIMNIAELLDHIAKAHSFLDMEGEFSIEYKGKKDAFKFLSESGQDFCSFEELN